ncbi:MAG: penicillin-binding protein, partial [Nocardiopsaceae bacterium]|nr:penicillin-binding protein [Nocardiopsaceae bacterium]
MPGGDLLSRTGALGRLVMLAALGGVLAAATVLPIVAATGISVRNAASSFTTLSLNASSLPQRSEILDAQGHPITYVYGVDLGPGKTYSGINRQPVGYNQISPAMRKAIVAIEDTRFWQRGAIDIKGTVRALVNDLEHKPIQGASTIEQQYVKDVLVLHGLGSAAAERAATADTLGRKMDQLRMAVQVAHTMSKKQILAAYLNDAFYGSGAWGIEAAAETYFHTTAAKLSVTQAATLAGIVEDPSRYDPLVNKSQSRERRNTVLARMMQTKRLSHSSEARALKQKLGLHPGAVQSGCSAHTATRSAFFCDYVLHTILLDKTFGATTADRAKALATGGLKIYTTLNPTDQHAATEAVNYVLPAHSQAYNPAGNAGTQVMMQPGTGKIMAIAEDRPYGGGNGQTEIDYAAPAQYGGSAVGVQTGSSSKLFTLITALEQGVPFGYTATVPGSTTISGYRNCQGSETSPFNVTNAEGPGSSTDTLYTGTTNSINVFYAELEKKVGLCNVVKTAAKLGLTTASGQSLLAAHADSYPAFTLGSVGVAPMSMAAAYATVASGGIYCKPVALSKVTDASGKSLPVPKAGCHRVLSPTVANAANYILQGVLTTGTGSPSSGGPGGLSGYHAAGKTGTSNVENGSGTPYAAFAGYTTNLVSYTSVFNPISPTGHTMAGSSACYRLEYGGASCPSEMFGANAPATMWHAAFDHADLKGAGAFPSVPRSSELWSKGNGQSAPRPPAKHGGGGGHPGGGPP